MSYRKERKYRLSGYDMRALQSKLLQEGMQQLHPERVIISQYFDRRDFKAFHDSDEAVLPRRKIRVRWYNDNQEKLTLETKISSIEGRYKTSLPIDMQQFEDYCASGYHDQDYGMLYPSVLVRYVRAYFTHKNIRITFDDDIHYSFNADNSSFRDFENVVEVKVPADISDDYLETIIATPVSKFSKYHRAFLLKNKNI
ncbi:MAG: VTC domain-containing protein [Alphaproteobacteria bacterium]|nr:VTC domain-containing protein [Alphaproteobacteria bacterium]